jgi:hypothetical protein
MSWVVIFKTLPTKNDLGIPAIVCVFLTLISFVCCIVFDSAQVNCFADGLDHSKASKSSSTVYFILFLGLSMLYGIMVVVLCLPSYCIRKDTHTARAMHQLIDRLNVYPIALIVCFTPATIACIVGFVSSQNSIDTMLYYSSAMAISSTGFISAMGHLIVSYIDKTKRPNYYFAQYIFASSYWSEGLLAGAENKEADSTIE